MPDCSDALFGTFAAAGAQRIGGNIDVCPGGVLAREPAEVGWCESTLEGNDSLKRSGRRFTSEQKPDRLTRCEATGEEVGGDSSRALDSILLHVAPRRRAQ